ncbi:carbohydrate binding domain-containing protein [Paenibacillus puerhi]|uniref:carbohydrate binding domain-containing protein n=1 Tax=Paenibacillus puerhi TaxID=2692622 RepID=UPI001F1F6627|nr:carbohydrate binding domain-containing protein [Paenibacillus puerhi]
MKIKKWLPKVISCCLVLALASPVTYPVKAEQLERANLRDLTGHWAQAAVEEMNKSGLMNGYEDGSFKPNQPISRAEFITVLDRIFGFNGNTSTKFKDVSPDDWYYSTITSAVGSGIMNGIAEDEMKPNAFITREDAAVVLDRAFQLSSDLEADSALTSFLDQGEIAVYAKKALTNLVGGHVFTGYNGMLDPKKLLTRAESATLLSKMVADLISQPEEFDKREVNGNVIIRSTGVILKHTVIHGNLILAEGIQEGDVTLDGITVTGSTIIQGGGSHSVKVKNSKLNHVNLKKRSSPVRVVIEDGSEVKDLSIDKPAILEVSQGNVIEQVTVGEEASNSLLTNKGSIKKLTIKANVIKLNGEERGKGEINLVPKDPSLVIGPSVVDMPVSNEQEQDLQDEQAVPSTTIPDQKWQLVWQDEFNEPELDTSKWTPQDTGVVYNHELEYYHPNNASIVKDGKRSVLRIEARKERHENSEYTSGKLISRNKGDWTYGKMVVRAKLPVQQGMWPAIWMMPTDEAHYGGWPASGEIDIMELIGGVNKNRVYGTLHFDSIQPDGSHGSDQGTFELPSYQSFSDAYHDFQMEWLPGSIRFYVDGQLYHEVNDWKTRGPGQPADYTYPAPFDRPFYMILNLAVGGDWPGAPKSDFVSDQMDVDFVRVYQYKDLNDLPDITGNPPEPVQKRAPHIDGNYIYNEKFTEGSDEQGMPNNWKYIENANGNGYVSIEDDVLKGKVAKLTITQPGDEIYSIQLTQLPMYIVKGKKYKVRFDAKADANRTMMSKVNQFGKSWKNYSGEQILSLTTEWQSFEYTFDMLNSTDNNARFEFNLGKNSTTTYFANVSLQEIGDATPLPDEEIHNGALADGNLIYNGTFDQGKNRLAFWSSDITPDAHAQISTNNFLMFPIMERQLVVQVDGAGVQNESVSVRQSGLHLEKNSEYGLSFQAKSDVPRRISIDLASTSENPIQIFGGGSFDLGTELQMFSTDISIGEGSSVVESELKLLFGNTTGTVYVDNVRLVKRGQPHNINGYAHISAADAWEMKGLQLENSSEGGKNISYMDEGDLLQYKLIPANAADYVVTARVASGVDDALIRFHVKDGSGTTIVQSEYALGNTGGWQQYKTITFDSFSLAAGQPYYVEFEGRNYNMLWLDLSANKIMNGGMAVDTSHWNLISGIDSTIQHSNEGELVVFLPGTGTEWWDHQLQQTNLLIEMGKTYRLEVDARASVPRPLQLVVSKSSGEYTKYLNEEVQLGTTSSHYIYTFTMNEPTDSLALLTFGLGKPGALAVNHTIVFDNIRLYEVNQAAEIGGQPTQVNLIQNGSFTHGTSGWFTYAAGDASQMSAAVQNGKLQTSIGSVGDNPWDRQLIQEGFAIQQGYRYTLSFKAKADTTRKMGLGIGWVDVAANYAWHGYFGQQVDLSTEEATYSFTFDATSESYLQSRITFDMGNISGGNAGNTRITISDVSLMNVGPL